MMKQFNSKKKIFINYIDLIKSYDFFYYLTNIIICSIFCYIYFFSLSNIINLWTYSEIHLNYSQGFIRRGLLGQVMLYLNDIGLSKKIFFSSIYFIISIINIIIFLKILRSTIKDKWIFFFFSFNPSLILFSFYDLGGYARSEIFGILLLLVHTFIFIKVKNRNIDLKIYKKIFISLLVPGIYISTLIHEINILTIFFHLFTTYNILKFYKKFKLLYLIKIFTPLIFLIPIVYYFYTKQIDSSTIDMMFNSLNEKENVNIWIWKSIFTSINERKTELQYMLYPKTNLLLYIFIFAFYTFPIFIFFYVWNRIGLYKLYISIIVVMPIFLLFFIGRDWGRWINFTIFILFCTNIQFLFFYVKKIQYNFRNQILNFIFILFITLQLTLTRIPHCCNLIEKNIGLFGGIITKSIIFYKLINSEIDIKERFKNYK
jgi:hypothetical protein